LTGSEKNLIVSLMHITFEPDDVCVQSTAKPSAYRRMGEHLNMS